MKINSKSLESLEQRIGPVPFLLWCAVYKHGPLTVPEMAEVTGRPLIWKLIEPLEELDLITTARTTQICKVSGFELEAWEVVRSHLLFDEDVPSDSLVN